MEKSASPFHAPSTGKRASSVIQQIFAAEHPDHFTRQVPAQRLYLAIKEQGLASSVEVLEMASREQFQIMLDFDLWSFDDFEEEQIWQWLELPDSTDDLTILQKLLHSIDPKLIAILISKYTEILVEEEPSTNPPGDGFYTPDKGHTWIKVLLEDEQQDFLFKRLLALIFETSTELFYQLIQIPSVTTTSVLQEQSYEEKTKRLAAEGFPEDEWAAELNSPLPLSTALQKVQASDTKDSVEDIYSIPVFIQSYSIPQPLQALLKELSNDEGADQEITLLCNAALIFFRVPTWEQEQVFSLVEQIRGVINIGLATLLEETDHSSAALYETLGMKGIYQVGLSLVFPLRNRALKISDDLCNSDPRLLALLAGLRFSIPKLPQFLESDGTFQEDHGKLTAGFRPIELPEDLQVADLLLAKLQKQAADL